MAFKKFSCLRIGRSPSRRRSPSPRHHEGAIAVFENQIPEDMKGRTNVKLVKSSVEPLGLTIAGGCDKFTLARVEHLRAGGMASRCDLLQVGDLISAVNGIRTCRLKHEDIINLLKNVGDVLNLELEYELPPAVQANPHCIQKVVQVTLDEPLCEGTGKGFVVRGGHDPNEPTKTRPLVVSHIRPDSVIDKEGTIKIGDRLIAAGNNRLDQVTLQDALEFCKNATVFTFQYSVSIVDQVQNATGPLLIEVAKPPGSSLGISLSTSIINQRHCVVISEARAASIADRCGALHIGDQILKIDGHLVDSLTLDDATRLLSSPSDQIKLEILPVSHARLAIEGTKSYNRYTTSIAPGQSINGLNGFNRMNTLRSSNNTFNRMKSRNRLRPGPSQMSIASIDCHFKSTNQVVHQDVCITELTCDPASDVGFGISLSPGVFATDFMPGPKLIDVVEEGSPADNSGIIQAGDRLVSINEVPLDDTSTDEAMQMLANATRRGRITLEIEFDIADSVVPSCGTFVLKLQKRPHQSLGITVSAPRARTFGQPLLISAIVPGSISHRTGSLTPGDKLIAINQHLLDNCTIEDAAQLLKNSQDIVRLKVEKEDDEENAICYSVELKRTNGILGITVTGSDDPFDPIIISGLAKGGIAERTRSIHEGDKILSINGVSLKAKPLQEAITLLRNAGEIIQLRIEKDEDDKNLKNGLTTGKLLDEKIEENDIEVSEDDDYISKHFSNRKNSSYKRNDLSNGDSALESWESGNSEISGNSNPSKIRAKHANYTSKTLGSLRETSRTLERNTTRHPSLPQKPFQSMDNLRQRSHSESRGRFASRPGSRHPSREASRDRSRASSRDRRKNEMRPVNFESFENLTKPDRKSARTYDDSSDDSNWDIVLNKNNDRPPSESSEFLDDVIRDLRSVATAGYRENIRAIVFRDIDTGSYGFSVSDGLVDKGVFIHSVKSDGPASRAGIHPYDKILQINNTRCNDMESAEVLSLIGSSGNRLRLHLSRNPAASSNPRLASPD